MLYFSFILKVLKKGGKKEGWSRRISKGGRAGGGGGGGVEGEVKVLNVLFKPTTIP